MGGGIQTGILSSVWRKLKRYLVAGSFLIILILFAFVCGNSAIGTADIFRTLSGNGSEAQRVILYQVRIPRIAAALF